MITIRKLSKFPPVSALRKAARILQGLESDLTCGIRINILYLKELIAFISLSPELRPNEIKIINSFIIDSENNNEELLRSCNSIRHLLLKHLGEEPADWDFFNKNIGSDQNIIIRNRTILPFEIYLDDIRSPFNVGSIFRSSESFGVSRIMVSQGTASPSHKRAIRTSMSCTEIIPWETIGKKDPESMLKNKNIFALEVNGEPMDQFNFPKDGVAIIGSEELGVSPQCLKMADNSYGRVSIPMGGIKGSINVSVAFGIMMYTWYNRIKSDL